MPSRLSSTSPERVVEQDAGARDDQPGAVAAAHRDRARVAVGVDGRDVRRRRRAPQRGQAVLADAGEQVGAVGLEVVREVVDGRAVGQHGALDLDHVVPGPVPAVTVAPRELAQHHRQHRAADRRRRVHRHGPAAGHGEVGGPDDRLVRRQVLGRDQAVVLGHARGQRPAHVPGREERRTLGREPVEGVAEVVVVALLAAPQDGPAVAGDQRAGLGVVGEERVGDEGQVARGGRAHRVGPRGGRRRLHQAGPGERGVPLGRHGERRHDARGGHRPVTRHHRHAAAVVGADLAHSLPEAGRVGAAAGHLHVAVHDDRVATGRPDRDVGAPTEADHAGLGRQRHEGGRQSRVHGVAAVGGHGQPGVDGLLAGGGDGDPADVGHVAHLGPRRHRATGPSQQSGGRRSQRRGCSRERRRPQGLSQAWVSTESRGRQHPWPGRRSAHRGDPRQNGCPDQSTRRMPHVHTPPSGWFRAWGQSRTSILPMLAPRCRSRNASMVASRPSTIVSWWVSRPSANHSPARR